MLATSISVLSEKLNNIYRDKNLGGWSSWLWELKNNYSRSNLSRVAYLSLELIREVLKGELLSRISTSNATDLFQYNVYRLYYT